MLVNCFTVVIPSDTKENIDTKLQNMYKDFGDNIPKYLPYESSKIVYLFCVNQEVDIKSICLKYECEYNGSYKMEIDDSLYNNNYTIHPVYFDKNKSYELVKE